MDPVPPSAPPYLRVATSPRMLGLLVLLLGAAVVCGMLGAWQLDRAALRGEQQAAERAAELDAAPPVPLADVLRPGDPFVGETVGAKVVLEGTVAGAELRVPGRAVDGRTGALVLTPVRTDDGALLPVVRGWVPDTTTPVQPLPEGTVELVGWLQAGEAAGESSVRAGEVSTISPARLANLWDEPTYTGYLVLQDVRPAQDPTLVTLPRPTDSAAGMNLQNLAYALQWWIFGGFAVLLWARIVRDEARDRVAPPLPVAEPAAPSRTGAAA